MKTYKYLLIIFSVLFLFACEKETEGLSRITYYCELELKGDPIVFTAMGGTYNEPGWIATENDVDVSDKVVVTGTVNTDAAGLYTLTYNAYNSDGFAKRATRRVVVSDPTPSPMESGFYTVLRNSDRNGTAYGNDFTILIYQVSPGRFYVSDLLGGWYEQRAGYGNLYAMVGHITLTESNTLTLVNSFVQGWQDGLDGLTNGLYNPDTKTLTYTAKYAGTLNFNVIATKQ